MLKIQNFLAFGHNHGGAQGGYASRRSKGAHHLIMVLGLVHLKTATGNNMVFCIVENAMLNNHLYKEFFVGFHGIVDWKTIEKRHCVLNLYYGFSRSGTTITRGDIKWSPFLGHEQNIWHITGPRQSDFANNREGGGNWGHVEKLQKLIIGAGSMPNIYKLCLLSINL